jgi:hypothetical protein
MEFMKYFNEIKAIKVWEPLFLFLQIENKNDIELGDLMFSIFLLLTTCPNVID